MKKFITQTVLLLALIGILLYFFYPNRSSKVEIPFLPQKSVISNLKINETILKVEIADTQSKRDKGLSNREFLAADSGMLFIFPQTDKFAFWMKGMKISLDFIWIKDNQVVDLLSNIDPPKSSDKDESLPIYSSKVEFNKVLEVNAGTIERLNIKVGDVIQIQ